MKPAQEVAEPRGKSAEENNQGASENAPLTRQGAWSLLTTWSLPISYTIPLWAQMGPTKAVASLSHCIALQLAAG